MHAIQACVAALGNCCLSSPQPRDTGVLHDHGCRYVTHRGPVANSFGSVKVQPVIGLRVDGRLSIDTLLSMHPHLSADAYLSVDARLSMHAHLSADAHLSVNSSLSVDTHMSAESHLMMDACGEAYPRTGKSVYGCGAHVGMDFRAGGINPIKIVTFKNFNGKVMACVA